MKITNLLLLTIVTGTAIAIGFLVIQNMASAVEEVSLKATAICKEKCKPHGGMDSLAIVHAIGSCGWGCKCNDGTFFDLCEDLRIELLAYAPKGK